MMTEEFNWITCFEKLPEDRKNVLWLHDLCLRKKYENIFDSHSYIVGYYMEEINSVCLCDLIGYDTFFKVEEFTHWMPLPEAPDEEKIALNKMLQDAYDNMVNSIWRPTPQKTI